MLDISALVAATAATKNIYISLLQEVKKLQQELERLRDSLEQARIHFTNLLARYEESIEKDAPFEKAIAKREDLYRIFDERRRSAELVVEELVKREGGWYELLTKQPGTIISRLGNITSTGFESIRDIRIESTIADKSSAIKPSEWLVDLSRRAIPLWNLPPAKRVAGRELIDIQLIGVEDANDSIFAPIESGPNVAYISTNDKHKVTLLEIIQGLHYKTLSSFEEYEMNYKLEGKKQVPVHVFGSLLNGLDLG